MLDILLYALLFFVLLILIIILWECIVPRIGMHPKNIFLPLPEEGSRPLLKEDVEKIITRSFHDVREKTPEILEKKYDCVVIGSGISGMISAGLLARAGKTVMILEQHDRLGGYTHEFTETGEHSGTEYSFCPGIHYLGKLNTTICLPLHSITNGHLKFREYKGREVYFHGTGDGEEIIKVDETGYRKLRLTLIKRFPEEEKAINRYFREMNKCVEHAMNYVIKQLSPWYIRLIFSITKSHDIFTKYSKTPVNEVMDSCGLKNEALRQYLYVTPLAYYNTAFMDKVDFASLSFIFMGVTYKNVCYGPYGSGGGCFPRTIIQNLPKSCPALCNVRVKNILFKNDKVCGVELGNGLGKISCDYVVSCAGYQNTYNMLPKKIKQTQAKHIPSLIEKYPYGGFFFITFVGLTASPKDLEINEGLVVLTGNKNMGIYDEIRKLKEPDFEGYENCYVFAISNDVEHEFLNKNPNRTKIQVLTFMSEKWVEKYEDTVLDRRGNEYAEIKKKIEDKVLSILYEKYPKMEDHVDYLDSSTSLTCKHYVNTPKGSGYGMVLNSEKWMKMSSDELVNPVKGLYFSGADILCGVGGGLYTSLNVVGRILKRNLYLDIKDARIVQKMKDLESSKKK